MNKKTLAIIKHIKKKLKEIEYYSEQNGIPFLDLKEEEIFLELKNKATLKFQVIGINIHSEVCIAIYIQNHFSEDNNIYVNIETLTEPVILEIFCAIPNTKGANK